MPLPFTVEITSKQHGDIKGSESMYGKSNIILSYRFDHEVCVNTDNMTESSFDVSFHEPVTIYKDVDCSSPILYQHLITGALLAHVVLRFYKQDDLGHEVNYHTIHLENALVTDISPQIRPVFLKENESFRHMESVSLTYQSIRWVDELESREAEDRTRLFDDDTNSELTLAGAKTALESRPKEDFRVMFVDRDSLEIMPNIKALINFPDGKCQEVTSSRTGDITLTAVDGGKYTVSGFDGKPSGLYRDNAAALVDVKQPAGKESQSFKPSSNGSGDVTHICTIKEHKVKQGDLFSEVAKTHGFSFEDLAFFNWGTRNRSEFPEQQLMRFDCGNLAPSGDEYILDKGVIYIPQPVTSAKIPTGISHVAYVKKAGTRQVTHTITSGNGQPVPDVKTTLALSDGSSFETVSDTKGRSVFSGIPADLEGRVTCEVDGAEASVSLKRHQAKVKTILGNDPEGDESTDTASVEARHNELNCNANDSSKDVEMGHPVNAVTGAVVETVTDFAVPGRMPLVWERHYSSQDSSPGLLGPGWQCPADARLVLEDDGTAVFYHGSKSASVFDRIPRGEDAVPDVTSDVFLHQNSSHFIITDKNNITRRFRKRTGVNTFFLESVRDSKGNALMFRRDVTGLRSIEDSSGSAIRVVSENGRIKRMIRVMPDGSESLLVSYDHDPKTGDLTAVYDVAGTPITYEYTNHCLNRLTLRSGQTFTYAYDSYDTEGKCVHTWGDDGLYDYRFTYNEDDQQTQITNSLGHVETITYDDGYRPVEATDHKGHATRYTYYENGKPESVIDPLGRKTTYEYDALHNLTCVTRPDGSVIRMAYDANCNPITITDPNGHVWRQAFEDRALLTSRISPTGSETRYNYNKKGDLISVTAPNGGITQFSYDPVGRITAITHADGSTERFERDSFGNITSAYDPLNRRTDYVYDESFRLARIIKPSGGVISCGYDADGRLIKHVDEAGHVTRLEYTGMGKIKRRINPDGTQVLYHYDTEERLKTLTNERGEIYEFKRDHAGRITHEIDYWGNERTYTFDPAGQLLESIDPLKRITRFKTDTLGRLIEKAFDTGKTESFDFDANGNLIAHENEHARTERVFDTENRLIQESINGRATTHEYDALGNRTRRLSPMGNDIRFAYDILGRTNGISINGHDMAITRNALGLPVKETFAGGIERTYDYTTDNQLSDQVVILPRGNTIKRSYEYDPVGNLTARIDADKGSRYFTYNPMGRITRYIDPEQTIKDFLHDPSGDLFKRGDTEEFDGSRHVTHDGTDYHFDAAGNLIERQGQRGHHTFDWDPNNRLASATNNQTNAQTRMTYDAQGRRLSKTTGDQTTTFLWDGDQLLSDNVGGQNQREFVYYPGSFEPLAIIDENQTMNLIHTDSVGLPQEVTDEKGDVVWSASFDSMGSVESVRAGGFDNPIRFQGQYYDPEIDLAYNRYRYFDAKVGSFVSQDLLGLAAGDNVYDYAPNVWGWVDPLGLCKENKGPDYLYRTISPEDPHYKQFKNIGDVGYIEPKGGHNNLTMHVQEDKTNSIFTSWSKNKDSNWDLWAGDDYIQLQVDARTMENHAIDVSEWSYFPHEEEVTVIGKLINVTRVR